MHLEDLETDPRLVLDRHPDDTDDPAVRQAPADRQLAEVLVKRDQDALLSMSDCQDRGVARVLRPVTNPLDIVARSAKLD